MKRLVLQMRFHNATHDIYGGSAVQIILAYTCLLNHNATYSIHRINLASADQKTIQIWAVLFYQNVQNWIRIRSQRSRPGTSSTCCQ